MSQRCAASEPPACHRRATVEPPWSRQRAAVEPVSNGQRIAVEPPFRTACKGARAARAFAERWRARGAR
eukprot:1102585-Lingulodinium_polyedra.AAC.1